MATGGIPLARVFVLLALVALVSIPNQAAAQDAGALLKTGLEKVRAGNYEEGIATLRKALAADPSAKDMQAALGSAEHAALIGLMASGQEGANVAKALLDRAMPILPEKAFDMAEMRRLIKTAVTAEEYADRFDAAMRLARVYGEFAVPGLVDYLKSSNTDYKANAHITLMNRIGRDAVLPLNEAMASEDGGVRTLVAASLGHIGDERSLAALAEAAGAEGGGKAAEALGKLTAKYAGAAGLSASDLYLRLAQLYYAGNYRVMANADAPLVLWSWTGGLESQPAPRHLYVLKLAEEACYDALRTNAENADARALLARVLASEKISAGSAGADDEISQAYAAGLANAEGTVAGMGWETLSQALSDALDQHDHAAAAFLLHAMPVVYGGDDFMAESAVVRGTTDHSGLVRLAACEAVLRINGARRVAAFPDPDGFIGLVGKSVGEVVPRQVLVADANDQRRNKMLTALNAANYIVFDARTGGTGIVRAVRLVGLDLIVLSSDLGNMEVLAAIHQLKNDGRTRDVPIVVVGSTEQAADAEWRNLYQGKAAALAGVAGDAGLAADDFVNACAGAFGGDSPDAKERYGRSAAILAALANTDTGNALFNWSGLTGTLSELLKADVPADPPVKANALGAMANIADGASLGALVEFFGSDADAGLRAAAANAISAVLNANPTTLDEASFGTLLKGTGDDDAGVRAASFAALGSSQLSAAQAASVATQNRPGTGG